MDNEDFRLTVTDLKQFSYCPRVIYYEQCLPHIRPRTYKMDAGRDMHEIEQKRSMRRTFSGYGLTDGNREYDVMLESKNLHLIGILDEIVTASDGMIFPVDYKLAKSVANNHRLQLAAYTLLLEDIRNCSVSFGYVYLIPMRKMVKIEITETHRRAVVEIITAIHQMVENEQMPSPAKNQNLCGACEFRRFCNDVR